MKNKIHLIFFLVLCLSFFSQGCGRSNARLEITTPNVSIISSPGVIMGSVQVLGGEAALVVTSGAAPKAAAP